MLPMHTAAPLASRDIFSTEYVRRLFDEMSATYGAVNYVSSAGFCERWRRQCVAAIEWRSGEQVYDLMTGMGELWAHLHPRIGATGTICAIDFSGAMCGHARAKLHRYPHQSISVLEADALASGRPSGSADAIVCSFGLKTLSSEQRQILAGELFRLLRPGGWFSFLEISVPPSRVLRWPYMFYLKSVIPLIGRMFLGNPENYRMLGVYTQSFGDCRETLQFFGDAGLEASFRSFFFGCATGVVGRRPL